MASPRRLAPEAAWGAFAAANVALMLWSQEWETIPFHFVWVSLTLLYGFRPWPLRETAIVLVATCAVTGGALAYVVVRGHQGWDETTEVPLMAAMFIAMVWHARRRERAAEAARAAREREREFIHRASHELRTPITVAKGYAEMIHHEEEDPIRRDEMQMILDELRRLSTLSERMLELAAMEHADVFLHHEQVDVGGLLRDVAARWSALTPPLRPTVRQEGTISADRERLVAALDALIENAIHATEGGGTISIEADAERGVAAIRVVDTGVGIEADELERIFQPFARSAKSSGRRGTGLGLSIVHAIVEGHGGRMHVTSKPGRTAFELHLPGFSAHDARRRPEPPAATEPDANALSRS